MTNIQGEDLPPGLLDARRIAYDIAMRAKWRKQKRSAQTRKRKDQEANDWHARVNAARAEWIEPGITKDRMHAIYTLLSFFLLTAPTEEDANWLYECIGEMKTELAQRSTGMRLCLVKG